MYRKLPPLLTHSLIPALAERLPRFRRIKRTLRTLPITDPAIRYASWLVSFTPEMQEQLIRPEFREPGYDPAWPFPHYYRELNGSTANDHLNRMMFVDVKSWLPDAYMEKSDKATMACGLEGRLPLLDHRLVELAFQIPGEQKVQGKSLKRILKRAVRDLVPAEVLSRPKHGFAVPLDPWFRGELKDYSFDVLLDARSRSRGYFDSAYVERLWREHVAGREVWDAQLYFLLNFELWHRIHLDGEAV
jgi:asparagine synthase (glutamine-hydrolysing)